MKPVVLSVIGTRPEAIKMSQVLLELRKHSESLRSIVCVTGQHRELLDQVLARFEIVPDFDLNLMTPGQTLPELTARLLTGLDKVVSKTGPSCILAQGDTTSVFTAGLIAYYHKIPFGHVEAGLRTGDKYRPFPEEMNRRAAGLFADVNFAPTENAKDALLREGVSEERILVTGNTAVDAVLKIASLESFLPKHIEDLFTLAPMTVLVTAHRRESFGVIFEGICLALRDLAVRFKDVTFMYPVHPNPQVQLPVQKILSDLSNMWLLEPLDYFEMVGVMQRVDLILTDSGGIQEEAPALGTPVLVMRSTTERREAVSAGAAKLIGTTRLNIFREACELIENHELRSRMSVPVFPFGDGHASEKIVSALVNRLNR